MDENNNMHDQFEHTEGIEVVDVSKPTIAEEGLNVETNNEFKYVDPYKNKKTENIKVSEGGAEISSSYLTGDPSIPAGSIPKTKRLMAEISQEEEDVIKALRNKHPLEVKGIVECIRASTSVQDPAVGKYFSDPANMGKLFNSYSYGGKDIGISQVGISDHGGKLSPQMLMAQVQSSLGFGYAVNIPLYHSGFRIIIAAPTVAELTNIELQIYKRETEVGRETASLVTASSRGSCISIIKEYIRSKITHSTLDVSLDSVDIFNYISILDFDAILLGILEATHLNKISVTRTCCNLLERDDSNPIKCSHTTTADLDPSKLLVVDRTYLTRDMLATISKRTPRSVSIAEQNNYVVNLNKEINAGRDRKQDVIINNVIFKLKVPTVNEFITESEIWIEDITSSLQKVLDLNSDVQRDIALDKLQTAKILSMYSSNVEKTGLLSNGQELLTSDRGQIRDGLGRMSGSVTVVNEILEAITTYISKSYVSMTATPNYVCPSCNQDQHDSVSDAEDFDAFIPLNMLDFFLTLVGDRLTKLQTNQMDM